MGRRGSAWDWAVPALVLGLIAYLVWTHQTREREDALRRILPPAQTQDKPVDLEDTI